MQHNNWGQRSVTSRNHQLLLSEQGRAVLSFPQCFCMCVSALTHPFFAFLAPPFHRVKVFKKLLVSYHNHNRKLLAATISGGICGAGPTALGTNIPALDLRILCHLSWSWNNFNVQVIISYHNHNTDAATQWIKTKEKIACIIKGRAHNMHRYCLKYMCTHNNNKPKSWRGKQKM